jgi:tripartite-type tricarboxylate transporter receptor subunit TctC
MRIATTKLRVGLIAVLAAWTGALANPAQAQAWPSQKPLSVLNPAPPGGALDVLLRSTSEFVSRRIGQQIIVESKSGGNGVPLGVAVANAPADGYLIGGNYGAYVVNPHTIKDLPYDTLRDFVPLTRLVDVTIALVAPPNEPFSSVPELIKYARENPAKVSYGQPGVGGASHFAFESIRNTANVSIQLIPYRGEGAMIPDLLGGRLNLAMLTQGTTKAQVQLGKIKILGLVASTRSPAFPGVPTVAETLPGTVIPTAWYGLFLRTGTPQAIVERLGAEYRASLQDAAVLARLEPAGMLPVGSTPAETAASIRAEIAWYGELIRKVGYKPE